MSFAASKSPLALRTSDGEALEIKYSNQAWQYDSRVADILLVDEHGQQIGRPWVTIVMDVHSRAITGVHVGCDESASRRIALALRHAILPKQYGPDVDWPTYGVPEKLLIDISLLSEHLQKIGAKLGFTCHSLCDPLIGGIIEGTFREIDQFFLGSNNELCSFLVYGEKLGKGVSC